MLSAAHVAIFLYLVFARIDVNDVAAFVPNAFFTPHHAFSRWEIFLRMFLMPLIAYFIRHDHTTTASII